MGWKITVSYVDPVFGPEQYKEEEVDEKENNKEQ